MCVVILMGCSCVATLNLICPGAFGVRIYDQLSLPMSAPGPAEPASSQRTRVAGSNDAFSDHSGPMHSAQADQPEIDNEPLRGTWSIVLHLLLPSLKCRAYCLNLVLVCVCVCVCVCVWPIVLVQSKSCHFPRSLLFSVKVQLRVFLSC